MAKEWAIRLGAFAGVLLAMALWELWRPRRTLTIGRRPRWPGNLGVVALDTLLVRALLPTAAVGVALICEARGWGLLHVLALPPWVAVPARRSRARLCHLPATRVFPPCARALAPASHAPRRPRHRRDDGRALPPARDHPLAPHQARRGGGDRRSGLAVLVFEVLLNASSLFNHSNVRMAAGRGAHRALARGHARHASRAPLDHRARRPTAISASTFPGGTACSAPTGRSRRRAISA